MVKVYPLGRELAIPPGRMFRGLLVEGGERQDYNGRIVDFRNIDKHLDVRLQRYGEPMRLGTFF
jgi:hypothetical protein